MTHKIIIHMYNTCMYEATSLRSLYETLCKGRGETKKKEKKRKNDSFGNNNVGNPTLNHTAGKRQVRDTKWLHDR